MANRDEIIEHLANRRWELALDPDNDGDDDTPGSGGDTDNDTPVASPAGVPLLIVGHIARAEHHVAAMKKAHDAKDGAKADIHHKAAKHHMAEAKTAAKSMGSY